MYVQYMYMSFVYSPQQTTPTIAMATPTPILPAAPSLFQCTSFETLGLKQPFTVHVSSNALMIMVSLQQQFKLGAENRYYIVHI